MDCTQALICSDEEDSRVTKEFGFLVCKGVRYPVNVGSNIIGRDDEKSDIVLPFESLSRQHAVIKIEEDILRVQIMDLRSINKTKVGSKTLSAYDFHPLKHGDAITLGNIVAIFEITENQEVPDTPAPSKLIRKIIVPESPDADSSRDESFIHPSQQPKNNVKRIPLTRPLTDSVFWNASTESPSLKLHLDSSESSKQSEVIGEKGNSNDSFEMAMNESYDIYEATTQISPSVHDAKTLVEMSVHGGPSIHEATTQPGLSIHEIETQLNDIRKMQIHEAETQPPAAFQKKPPAEDSDEEIIFEEFESQQLENPMCKESQNLLEDLRGAESKIPEVAPIKEADDDLTDCEDDVLELSQNIERVKPVRATVDDDDDTDCEEAEDDFNKENGIEMGLTQIIIKPKLKENKSAKKVPEKTLIEEELDVPTQIIERKPKKVFESNTASNSTQDLLKNLENKKDKHTKTVNDVPTLPKASNAVVKSKNTYSLAQDLVDDIESLKNMHTETANEVQPHSKALNAPYKSTQDLLNDLDSQNDNDLTQIIHRSPSQPTKTVLFRKPAQMAAKNKSTLKTTLDEIEFDIQNPVKPITKKPYYDTAEAIMNDLLTQQIAVNDSDVKGQDLIKDLESQKNKHTEKVNDVPTLSKASNAVVKSKNTYNATKDLVADIEKPKNKQTEKVNCVQALPKESNAPYESSQDLLNDLDSQNDDDLTQIIHRSPSQPTKTALFKKPTPLALKKKSTLKTTLDEIEFDIPSPIKPITKKPYYDTAEAIMNDLLTQQIGANDSDVESQDKDLASLSSVIVKPEATRESLISLNARSIIVSADDLVPSSQEIDDTLPLEHFPYITKEPAPFREKTPPDSESSLTEIFSPVKNGKPKPSILDMELPNSDEIENATSSPRKKIVVLSSSDSEAETEAESEDTSTPIVYRSKPARRAIIDISPVRQSFRRKMPTLKLRDNLNEITETKINTKQQETETHTMRTARNSQRRERNTETKKYTTQAVRNPSPKIKQTKQPKSKSSNITSPVVSKIHISPMRDTKTKETIKNTREDTSPVARKKRQNSPPKNAETKQPKSKSKKSGSPVVSKRRIYPQQPTEIKEKTKNTSADASPVAQTKRRNSSPKITATKEPRSKSKKIALPVNSKCQISLHDITATIKNTSELKKSSSPKTKRRISTPEKKRMKNVVVSITSLGNRHTTRSNIERGEGDGDTSPKLRSKRSSSRSESSTNEDVSKPKRPKREVAVSAVKRSGSVSYGGSSDSHSGSDTSPVKRSDSSRSHSSVAAGTKNLRSSFVGEGKCAVMFTGLKDPKLEKIVENLGGTVVSDPAKCTVLITERVKRTLKFLLVLGLRKPIVGFDWLYSSQSAKMLLDPWSYILVDPEFEKKHSFTLKRTLKSPSNFLDKVTLTATPSIQPPPEDVKLIVEYSGGTYLNMESATKKTRGSKSSKKSNDVLLCLSCKEDVEFWPNITRFGYKIVSMDTILTGMLRNKLEWQQFAFKSY